MLEVTKGNFSVRLLKHSANPTGREAISWLVTYERFIHAEVMTHRWERNFSSSRAVPYAKMVEWIKEDPALPLHLGRNQSGMQSGAEVDKPDEFRRMLVELFADTVEICNYYVDEFDPHKEIINRYLEPWAWITGIMTMGRDQLMNFFTLRCSRYAHPNIQRLAVTMARLYFASTPQRLDVGDWHVPFIDDHIPHGKTGAIKTELIWSVARAAWCSYNSPTKDATFSRAKIRHDDCVANKHMTPLGHQLMVRSEGDGHGVVPGYDSYRSMIPGEMSRDFDPAILETVYKGRDYVV